MRVYNIDDGGIGSVNVCASLINKYIQGFSIIPPFRRNEYYEHFRWATTHIRTCTITTIVATAEKDDLCVSSNQIETAMSIFLLAEIFHVFVVASLVPSIFRLFIFVCKIYIKSSRITHTHL